MGKDLKFVLSTAASEKNETTPEQVEEVESEIFKLMINDYKLQGELDT